MSTLTSSLSKNDGEVPVAYISTQGNSDLRSIRSDSSPLFSLLASMLFSLTLSCSTYMKMV